MNDMVLLYLLTGLLFLAAFMKLALAKKKQETLTRFWLVQRFVFPVMMLVVLILFRLGIRDWLIQGIFLGILEELVFWFIRKKKSNQ